MNQDYTVKQFTDRNKADNFGNKTYTVVFDEDPRPVYLASKGDLQIGHKKYGRIESGQYGPKFKSEKRDGEGFAPPQGTGYQPRSPKKSDDERSNDIRWGLTIKEANAYIIANRPNLDADKWSKEVIEYASALYAISDEPVKVQEEPPLQDQLPDDMLDNHGLTADELGEIPF